jgi:hypothetical protein
LAVYKYAQGPNFEDVCNYSGDGWELRLSSRNAWYDLTGAYNNETSAYKMGNHSGHLSENNGGGGYWCPYDTSVRARKANLNGTGWSDRISSRYRN